MEQRKDLPADTDWNTASYEDFLKRQSELRHRSRGTTPLMEAGNYPELMERRNILRAAGFEADEHSSGGLSIFVENEEQFKKLQKLATEKNLKIKMAMP